ncbi:MAG: Molybdate/tungstate transport system permease protein WtpB [Methanobacterium sp. PtaB.Bin024]|nr:MAG: Molybdate/tungstate transport system permease protein WtpB [Methanobacterium sp. PtaB.Bin024]
MKSKMEISFISIAIFFTLILFMAVGSLFILPSFQGFIDAIQSEEMVEAFKLTIYTAAISSVLVMLVAIPTAYSLSRYSFPLKTLIKSILDLPMAFPEIVLGLALLMLFGNNLLGGFLEKFGIQIVFTVTGVIVAQFFVAFPFAVRILYSTFNYIDTRYEFVSRSLGYSEFETFRSVTLPLSKDGIFASGVVTIARCIGTFVAVLFLGGGTFMKTETLPITLYLNLSFGNVDMAISAGIVLVIIAFVAIVVLEKYGKEKAL